MIRSLVTQKSASSKGWFVESKYDGLFHDWDSIRVQNTNHSMGRSIKYCL